MHSHEDSFLKDKMLICTFIKKNCTCIIYIYYYIYILLYIFQIYSKTCDCDKKKKEKFYSDPFVKEYTE